MEIRAAVFRPLGKDQERLGSLDDVVGAGAKFQRTSCLDEVVKILFRAVDGDRVGCEYMRSAGDQFSNALNGGRFPGIVGLGFECEAPDGDLLSGDIAHFALERVDAADISEAAFAGWHDCLLSLASLSLSTGQFNDAMESVNTVLADVPKDREALEMRSRIEVTANDWGWWR